MLRGKFEASGLPEVRKCVSVEWSYVTLTCSVRAVLRSVGGSKGKRDGQLTDVQILADAAARQVTE